jgi:hypothetical protein
VRDNGTTNGANDFKTDTGTVNVTVTEVNDPPKANTDSGTVPEDDATGILIDVLANDAKGPANESGQTLTITGTSASSHGNVTIESGKIRYKPTEANYNGPDSFTYTIEDNGTTNGSPDHKTDTGTVNITVTPVNDNPTVGHDNASATVNEGQTAQNTGTFGDVDGDTVSLSASVGTVTKNANGTWSWSYATTDGGLQSGTVTISANDGHGGTASTTFSLTVNNVKPTINSWAADPGSLSGPMVVSPVTFNGNFSDPGVLDMNWVISYTWDGVADAVPQTRPSQGNWSTTHTFTTAGCAHTAKAVVQDKDGAASDAMTATFSVGTGAFLPPMTNQPVTDKLKNGQVLPVKVEIKDCNGNPVTGLQPAIQLKKGDLTAANDDTVVGITPESVSSADTTGIMRAADGHYMYNMRVNVPNSDLNTDYTVIIYPYGLGNQLTSLRHVIRATK